MRIHLLGTFCACAIAAFVTPATAVTVNYSNTTNSEISFDNTNDCVSSGDVGCFNFVPALNNIEITSGGSSNGFLGTISGTYGVGPISSAGGLEQATVNGAGALSITDGAGDSLTATLTWVDIFTFGVIGGTNVGGSANLSSISYTLTGSNTGNSDLLALASAGSGIQTASFQFTNLTSLTNLFSGNDGTTTNTSFSGSITAVPVPAALWLLGSGLLGLVGIARRRNS